MSQPEEKSYYVTDRQIGTVPYAHDLDGLTRFQMKLNRLDVVAAVHMPLANDYRIHDTENDFVWYYKVQRKPGVSWAVVDAAICRAAQEFLAAFATG